MADDKIRERLITKGKELLEAPGQTIPFTPDENANALIIDLTNTPHAFVIACIMDRQIKAERAWRIPHQLAKKLGTFEFTILHNLGLEKIQKKPLQSCKRVFSTGISVESKRAFKLLI